MDKNLEEKLVEQHVEDLAGKRALAEPLPGPLNDAFALAPDIKVGPYSVRRFRDGDFKILKAINSPLNEFLRACMLGDNTGNSSRVEPTGQDMWNIAWVFTRPASCSRDLISGSGAKELEAQAEAEFGEFRFAAQLEILKAVMKQANIYATANIAYGPVDEKGENGESRPNPTTSSAVGLTDLGGSLIKNAV